jgi:hypothetical protein
MLPLTVCLSMKQAGQEKLAKIPARQNTNNDLHK